MKRRDFFKTAALAGAGCVMGIPISLAKPVTFIIPKPVKVVWPPTLMPYQRDLFLALELIKKDIQVMHKQLEKLNEPTTWEP